MGFIQLLHVSQCNSDKPPIPVDHFAPIPEGSHINSGREVLLQSKNAHNKSVETSAVSENILKMADVRTIEVDIPRTFPQDPLFCLSGKMIQLLCTNDATEALFVKPCLCATKESKEK